MCKAANLSLPLSTDAKNHSPAIRGVFLPVTYVDIQGIKKIRFSFFAPKLAHKWTQTVGAKTE